MLPLAAEKAKRGEAAAHLKVEALKFPPHLEFHRFFVLLGDSFVLYCVEDQTEESLM